MARLVDAAIPLLAILLVASVWWGERRPESPWAGPAGVAVAVLLAFCLVFRRFGAKKASFEKNPETKTVETSKNVKGR